MQKEALVTFSKALENILKSFWAPEDPVKYVGAFL